MWYANSGQGLPETQEGNGIDKNQVTSVVIADNLKIPWDMAFLPGGALLISERIGRLLVIEKNGAKKEINIEGVSSRGEGGLLGLALHPDFEKTNWLYLY